MVQQCLRTALLDEVIVNLVPVLLGDGVRLFEDGSPGDYELAIDNVI
jgi:dihydrofolate reductase